jgi:hypothetical protein
MRSASIHRSRGSLLLVLPSIAAVATLGVQASACSTTPGSGIDDAGAADSASDVMTPADGAVADAAAADSGNLCSGGSARAWTVQTLPTAGDYLAVVEPSCGDVWLRRAVPAEDNNLNPSAVVRGGANGFTPYCLDQFCEGDTSSSGPVHQKACGASDAFGIFGLPDPGIEDRSLWSDPSGNVWMGARTCVIQWKSDGEALSWGLNDNRRLTVVGGSGPNDVWGNDLGAGYVGHFDGDTWAMDPLSEPPAVGIASFWGSDRMHYWGASNLSPFALDAGLVNELIGPSDVPDASFVGTFFSVWGMSATNIWAVGQVGAIVHWDGGAWSPLASPTVHDLHSVWGTGPADVWAAGDNGTILHYDGGSWTTQSSPTTNDLRAIGGFGSDVWIVGLTDTVLHFGSK